MLSKEYKSEQIVDNWIEEAHVFCTFDWKLINRVIAYHTRNMLKWLTEVAEHPTAVFLLNFHVHKTLGASKKPIVTHKNHLPGLLERQSVLFFVTFADTDKIGALHNGNKPFLCFLSRNCSMVPTKTQLTAGTIITVAGV